MVESRIRHLVLDLENTENIVIAHPSTITINNSFICLSEEEQAGASQGELSMDAMLRKDADYVEKEHKRVYTKNFFIGLEIEKKPSK
jgi:poly(A) polymerase